MTIELEGCIAYFAADLRAARESKGLGRMWLHSKLAQDILRNYRVDGARVYKQAELLHFPRVPRVRNDDIDEGQTHDCCASLET